MSTFRGEMEASGDSLNSRKILQLPSTQAGTNPGNPLQVGLGMSVTIAGNEAITSVIGTMIYMADADGTEAASVAFIKDTTTNNWVAEGAVGGTQMGFPADLDYGTPKPFEFKVQIFYRGGNKVTRYGLWVADGSVSHCAPCYTRDGFAGQFLNACLAGHGYRYNDTTAGGSLYNPYGEYGDWAAFWEPGDHPDFAGWAQGLSGIVGGYNLNLVVNPSLIDDDAYVHVPDVISGNPGTFTKLLNPFVTPSVTPTARTKTQHLSQFALDTTTDTTSGGRGAFPQSNTSATGPSSPSVIPDRAGALTQVLDSQYPAGKPPIAIGADGYNRLPQLRGPIAAAPADRSSTASSGSIVPKHGLTAEWSGDGVNDDGSLVISEASTTGTSLMLSGYNFQPTDRVYFILGAGRPGWGGPETGATVPPQLASPLGFTPDVVTTPVVEPRETKALEVISGTPPWDTDTVAPLFTAHADFTLNAVALSPVLLASGNWQSNGLGAVLELNGATSFTVDFLPDVTYAASLLSAFATFWGADSVGSIELLVQAIVLQNGYTPTPLPTGTTGKYGVLWPMSTVLSRPAVVRMRA